MVESTVWALEGSLKGLSTLYAILVVKDFLVYEEYHVRAPLALLRQSQKSARGKLSIGLCVSQVALLLGV